MFLDPWIRQRKYRQTFRNCYKLNQFVLSLYGFMLYDCTFQHICFFKFFIYKPFWIFVESVRYPWNFMCSVNETCYHGCMLESWMPRLITCPIVDCLWRLKYGWNYIGKFILMIVSLHVHSPRQHARVHAHF